MKLEFNDIWFKNIFSYGDIENRLDFKTGISLLTSIENTRSNGIGKSSALMTIPFGVFGKTPKRTVQGDIINWKNNKDCFTGINMHKDSIPIKIERSLKPNNLDVWVNDEILPKDSSVTITQEKLNEMFKWDLRIFNNLIYCSNNTISIIEATPTEKRKFLENLFDIEFISILNDKVTKKITKLNNEKTTLSQNLNIHTTDMESLRQKLIKYNEDIDISLDKSSFDSAEKVYNGYIRDNVPLTKERIESYIKVKNKLSLCFQKLEKENIEISNNWMDVDKNLNHVRKLLKIKENEYCGYDKLDFYRKEIREYALYIEGDLDVIGLNIKKYEDQKRDIEGTLKNYSFIDKELKQKLNEILDDPGNVVECPTCGANTDRLNILKYQNKKGKEISNKIEFNLYCIDNFEKKLIASDHDIKRLQLVYSDHEKQLKTKKELENSILENEKLLIDIVDYKSDIKTIEEQREEIKKLLKTDIINKVKYKFTHIDNKITKTGIIINEINNLKNSLDLKKKLYYSKLSEIDKHAKIIGDLKDEVKQKEIKVTGCSKNIKDMNTTHDYLSYIKDGCQDKRIKQWIINDSMVYINDQANYYLSSLGINYYLKISGFLDVEINGLGVSNVNIKSLSSGEQRSIDLAIKFALMDTSQMRNNLFVDILILDEILDGAIDEEGISQLTQLIKVRQEDYNLKVLLTSHRKELKDIEVNHLYEIDKLNGFSNIKLVY